MNTESLFVLFRHVHSWRGGHPLTPLAVMVLLESCKDDGETPMQCREELNNSSANLTQAFRALEDAGLGERGHMKGDWRRIVFNPSAKGRAFVRALVADLEEELNKNRHGGNLLDRPGDEA